MGRRAPRRCLAMAVAARPHPAVAPRRAHSPTAAPVPSAWTPWPHAWTALTPHRGLGQRQGGLGVDHRGLGVWARARSAPRGPGRRPGAGETATIQASEGTAPRGKRGNRGDHGDEETNEETDTRRRVRGRGEKKREAASGSHRAGDGNPPPRFLKHFCFQVGPKMMGCEVGMEATFDKKDFNFYGYRLTGFR
jgi:hypothetical protein